MCIVLVTLLNALLDLCRVKYSKMELFEKYWKIFLHSSNEQIISHNAIDWQQNSIDCDPRSEMERNEEFDKWCLLYVVKSRSLRIYPEDERGIPMWKFPGYLAFLKWSDQYARARPINCIMPDMMNMLFISWGGGPISHPMNINPLKSTNNERMR